MIDLRRVQIDPDGLITQDQRGMMLRVPLPPATVEALGTDPLGGLRSLAKADNGLARVLDGSVPPRIEAAMDRVNFLPRPLRVYYGLEPRCNLKCPYCGPRDFHGMGSPVDPAWEMYLLGQIAAAGAFQVQLTGGEIGIRGFDLLPVLERAAELGLAVLFSTNGVWNCIDKKDEFMTELARFNNIIQSKISIEGTLEFHDSVRGEGTYAAAVETLAKLSHAGLNPRISTTIFAENCNSRQLRHLASLAKTYRAGFQPIPMRPVGRASSLTLRAPTTEQLAAYTKELTELRAAERQPISFNFDIIQPTHDVPVFDVHHSASCGASMWGVHVTHRGEVYPCGFAQEINGGVTFLSGQITPEVSLLDIWLNSQVLASVRDAGKSEKCQACGHYGHGCWGGCWVMGWHATGRVSGMDSYCFVDSLPPA